MVTFHGYYRITYNTVNQLQVHFMCDISRYNKRKYSIMADILEFSPHHIMHQRSNEIHLNC